MNLALILEASAERLPDRTAVVLGATRLSYAAVNAASCPNIPSFPVIYYGILKAGAVVVPLNVLLKGCEIAYHLADLGAKAYSCFEGASDLPIGQEGWVGFSQTETCEHFFIVTHDCCRNGR